jgi:hypothetical protein
MYINRIQIAAAIPTIIKFSSRIMTTAPPSVKKSAEPVVVLVEGGSAIKEHKPIVCAL